MKLALIVALGGPLVVAVLSERTRIEFKPYMDKADSQMLARAVSEDRLPAGAGLAPVIRPWDGKGLHEIHGGLIHDWIGSVFVPNGTAAGAVAVLQDVDRYKEFYAPACLASRLVSRDGNRLKASMRVVKKKVIEVVLDTEYDVEYKRFPNGRWQVWSRSTRIAEIEGAGTRSEKASPPDTGWGFLWRLNTYWQIEEREGGVYMECRAISLTRDIPIGLAWIVKPMVTSLPRESLAATLEDTRRAVAARPKA